MTSRKRKAVVTQQGQVWVHSTEGATHRGTALDLAEQNIPLWGAVVSPHGVLRTWQLPNLRNTRGLLDRLLGQLNI